MDHKLTGAEHCHITAIKPNITLRYTERCSPDTNRELCIPVALLKL